MPGLEQSGQTPRLKRACDLLTERAAQQSYEIGTLVRPQLNGFYIEIHPEVALDQTLESLLLDAKNPERRLGLASYILVRYTDISKPDKRLNRTVEERLVLRADGTVGYTSSTYDWNIQRIENFRRIGEPRGGTHSSRVLRKLAHAAEILLRENGHADTIPPGIFRAEAVEAA